LVGLCEIIILELGEHPLTDRHSERERDRERDTEIARERERNTKIAREQCLW
jgi:hypothetical protein